MVENYKHGIVVGAGVAGAFAVQELAEKMKIFCLLIKLGNLINLTNGRL